MVYMVLVNFECEDAFWVLVGENIRLRSLGKR